MSQWRSLHAYSADCDGLLIEEVGPFFEERAASLDHGFWERHYAAGSHLRLRLRAPQGRVDDAMADLRARLERWLVGRSSASAIYSAATAARLLRAEGVDPASEDLVFRSGVVLERPYPEPGKRFASAGARELAEDFRRARGPLALEILRGRDGRREATFSLFLALALFVGRGVYPKGCVSFKSHWEHFAAALSSEEALARIESNYDRNRTYLLRRLRDVEDQAAGSEPFSSHPLLRRWWLLLEQMHVRATAILESGQNLTDHPSTPEQAAALSSRMRNVRRPSKFVETMWSDERFTLIPGNDLRFQRPRALVNLLYELVAAIGLSPIDKLALCHHTVRAVEESFGCDLTDVLRSNIETVVAQGVAPPQVDGRTCALRVPPDSSLSDIDQSPAK